MFDDINRHPLLIMLFCLLALLRLFFATMSRHAAAAITMPCDAYATLPPLICQPAPAMICSEMPRLRRLMRAMLMARLRRLLSFLPIRRRRAALVAYYALFDVAAGSSLPAMVLRFTPGLPFDVNTLRHYAAAVPPIRQHFTPIVISPLTTPRRRH